MKCMECMRWLTRFIEFSFWWLALKSIKLKDLGSMRSVFAQTIVWRGRRGDWGKSELVWSNQRFGHPSLDPICPVLQHVGPSMLCNMLGERFSSELAVGAFGRSPPHLFLYLLLFKTRKIKVETKKGLCWFLNTGESKINFIESKGCFFIWNPKFFILFYFIF